MHHSRKWRTGSVGSPHPISRKRSRGGCITKPGYRQVLFDGKYQMEHRVIYAKFLGRELTPEENIHHKNGDRSDNRLENLELWSTKQPYGQRVEDKVKYAKEILALYGSQ